MYEGPAWDRLIVEVGPCIGDPEASRANKNGPFSKRYYAQEGGREDEMGSRVQGQNASKDGNRDDSELKEA